MCSRASAAAWSRPPLLEKHWPLDRKRKAPSFPVPVHVCVIGWQIQRSFFSFWALASSCGEQRLASGTRCEAVASAPLGSAARPGPTRRESGGYDGEGPPRPGRSRRGCGPGRARVTPRTAALGLPGMGMGHMPIWNPVIHGPRTSRVAFACCCCWMPGSAGASSLPAEFWNILRRSRSYTLQI